MTISQIIKQEVLKLKPKSHVDQQMVTRFLNRLNQDTGLMRYQNPKDHFCVFFLPVCQSAKRIYLGHHKKAEDWIPPGGHLEKNEDPYQTIKREIKEELSYQLNQEKIIFFDLTIKPIAKKHPCQQHWDLWYLLFFNQPTVFKYDRREFHQAQWLDIKKAIPKINQPDYRQVVEKVKQIYLA